MRTVSEPKRAYRFEILPKHVAAAKPNDACHCVIAQALMEKNKASLLEAQVFSTVTSLHWSGGKVQRYKTPDKLKEALREFDKTKQWNLPPGVYKLEPLPQSQRKKAQRERARTRRANGDAHMTTKYIGTGRCRARPMNPRVMNLVALRQECGE